MTTEIPIDTTKRVQLVCQVALRLVCLVFLAGSSGCLSFHKRYGSSPTVSPFNLTFENKGVGRFKSKFIVEQMEEFYRGGHPGPIGVATFVNIDDLYTSSTFGRIYAEQLISELAMAGFDVVELRQADALQFLSTTGEFALSRDVSVLRRERNLGGVVVGTYAVSPDRVYVNARLVDPTNSMVLTAGSVEMPKTKELTQLLRGGGFPSTLERIPVKHLAQNPQYGPPPWWQGQVWNREEQAMGNKNTTPSLIDYIKDWNMALPPASVPEEG